MRIAAQAVKSSSGEKDQTEVKGNNTKRAARIKPTEEHL
jgi:hypothetical protein